MEAQEWPYIVRALRQLHGVSLAQFALMTALTEETVGRWESGRNIPDPREQALLRDMLTGHCRQHPTFVGLQAMVRSMGEKCTLYTPGMMVHTISPSLDDWLRQHRLDLVGTSILRRLDGLSLDMMERYALPMLEGRSDVLSLSYKDRAVACRRTVLQRRMSVVPMDGVRAIVLIDQPILTDDGLGMPDLDLHVVTADDVHD